MLKKISTGILLLGAMVSGQGFAASTVNSIDCHDSMYESSETGSGERIASWQFRLLRSDDGTYSLWYNYWHRSTGETEDLVANDLSCKFEDDQRLFTCDSGQENLKKCVASMRQGATYFIANNPRCSMNSNPIPRRSFFQTRGASGCFVK